MKNSGQDLLMKSAFAGVEKMLIAKKFPMNVRALRIVVIELLRSIMNNHTTKDQFYSTLNDLARQSKLAKHWIQNLIEPVFLMMMYVRAERESDIGLHLYACRKMIPYFFAAGHWNYARDSLVYIRSMEKLPNDLMNKLMKEKHVMEGHGGQHAVHIKDGIFNGIWSDMAIETTYMKVGKGPAGVIGVTTNERSVSIWSNSHHLCGQLLTELADLSDKDNRVDNKTHKEEGIRRIKSDENDRSKIKTTLGLGKCIHPLQIDSHGSDVLANIYTGEESTDSVNVDKVAEIGKRQINDFQKRKY